MGKRPNCWYDSCCEGLMSICAVLLNFISNVCPSKFTKFWISGLDFYSFPLAHWLLIFWATLFLYYLAKWSQQQSTHKFCLLQLCLSSYTILPEFYVIAGNSFSTHFNPALQGFWSFQLSGMVFLLQDPQTPSPFHTVEVSVMETSHFEVPVCIQSE